jgi:hypothetical protein
MRIGSRDAWIIARLLCGRVPVADGEVEPMLESERIRPLADRLRETDPDQRAATWKGFLTGRSDRDDWAGPVGEADPAAPPPPEQAEATARPRANLGDVKRLLAETEWPWPGWLAGGVLNTLASHPGEGKTILAMNLARVLWNGWPWPDGAANPLPARTKTLWVPGDRHYPQLVGLAGRYGLPDEAMLFNAPADNPAEGHDLDEGAVLDELEEAIRVERPGLVIVDTVIMTTRRNLGRPEEARAFFGPLMDIAGNSRVSFLLVTHLSKESQALGRRIVGASRVVWKLTKPDPENQPDRRKLWVDKSYAVVPKPMGMTIAADGCTFDDKPPEEPGRDQGSQPATKAGLCRIWLKAHLDPGPARVKDARRAAEAEGFTSTPLYTAARSLKVEQYEIDGRKWWKLPKAP